MATFAGPLPHWSWEDLETAFDRLSPTGRDHPLREHLLRRLKSEATTTSPVDLLSSLLGAALLVSQLPSSATGLRHEDRSFG